jgi:hypothetical protein
VTLAALAVWRHRGFTFGNRYSFFAASLAHLIIGAIVQRRHATRVLLPRSHFVLPAQPSPPQPSPPQP